MVPQTTIWGEFEWEAPHKREGQVNTSKRQLTSFLLGVAHPRVEVWLTFVGAPK